MVMVLGNWTPVLYELYCWCDFGRAQVAFFLLSSFVEGLGLEDR